MSHSMCIPSDSNEWKPGDHGPDKTNVWAGNEDASKVAELENMIDVGLRRNIGPSWFSSSSEDGKHG